MEPGLLAKVLCVCSGLALSTASASAQDDSHAQLARLIGQGDDLMARALGIAEKRPQTQSQVDTITEGSTQLWMRDENALQTQLSALLDRYRDLPPDMKEGVNRLVRFANYAFNGLTHIAFCENVEADWDLGIAAQFLQHAKLAGEGHADPDWHPDLQSDPKAKGECR